MDADKESHETDDHPDADDETPIALRASKLGKPLLAKGTIASGLRRGLDLAPQIIEQAINVTDSEHGALVEENMEGGLLPGTRVFESGAPNFLAVGVSLSGGSQSQSAVPEPSALILIAFGSMAVCGKRLRVVCG